MTRTEAQALINKGGREFDAAVAEAMGKRRRTHASLNGCMGWPAEEEYWHYEQNGGGECMTHDRKPWMPSRDANADYSVLEWVRKQDSDLGHAFSREVFAQWGQRAEPLEMSYHVSDWSKALLLATAKESEA